jgi:threonylcarbamoyladenosine tRNA methylthiotransferase MtaB
VPELMTLGCRLNAAESESIGRLASDLGNALIVNTCAVTSEAVRQARQAIRRAHRADPSRPILVTGCAVETEPETFRAMPEVSLLIGNAAKLDPATWRRNTGFGLEAERSVQIGDIHSVRAHAGHLAEAFEGQTRAFLEVQNGCDHRCTFCIIPFGRGPARSVAPGAVVDAVKRLVGGGAMEIVLTGVDLTSYGPDLPGKPSLGALVKAILRHVPDLPRLRLSSIDSIEADEHLIEAIGAEARLMPHLHLSLQAGSDIILKRMKRRHLSADALAFCETIRAIRPDIVFGADVIAGFPTETEIEAEETRDHIEACGITHLHVFPFSPRKGTPAARMPQVAHEAIRARAKRLRESGAAAFQRHLRSLQGRILPVLTERGGTGRAEDFTPVALPPDLPHGVIVPLSIEGIQKGRLIGRVVESAKRAPSLAPVGERSPRP